MSSKYGNKKVVWNGETFDSQKELSRYQELLLLQKAGVIQDLQRQVKYVLIPAYYETRERTKNGKRLRPERWCVERSVSYYADFVYTKDGKTVVEDTKGARTQSYIIKRKLMLDRYRIKIVEV